LRAKAPYLAPETEAQGDDLTIRGPIDGTTVLVETDGIRENLPFDGVKTADGQLYLCEPAGMTTRPSAATALGESLEEGRSGPEAAIGCSGEPSSGTRTSRMMGLSVICYDQEGARGVSRDVVAGVDLLGFAPGRGKAPNGTRRAHATFTELGDDAVMGDRFLRLIR
jgi:hypothetical protein